ncbi:MAG: hypothetical protein RJA22_1250 [Verrucomicrobiota bacterium]
MTGTMQPASGPVPPSLRQLSLFLGILVAAIFVVGLTGLPNLVDNERRVGAYILDALHNGHLMAQRDSTGDVISKPPMITWMSALATLPFGHLNRFSLYLPGALAAAALAVVLLRAGTVRFGWVAGFLAGLTYVMSPLGDKVVQTARYDGLFALPVTVTALAAYRAWTTGGGWTWFWLAAAWATLVKGPLGLVLGAAGLTAALWEWRSGARQPLRGSHWVGVALFLALCGGWLWLGYLEMGQPLLDKLFKRELMKHALKGSDSEGIGVGFWEPTVAFITLYLPWSLAGLAALWRVVWRPAADPAERRFERFLFCWFIIGLLIFSLAAHQRSRLVMPIIPALALLAGREMAGWVAAWPARRLLRTSAAAAVVMLAGLVVYRQVLLRDSSSIQRTLACQALSSEIRATLGTEFPLTYIDSPFAVQFRLNTLRFQATPARAAALLAGSVPAFVVAGNEEAFGRLRQNLGTNAPLHELRVFGSKRGPILHLVSNQPRLEWPNRVACLNGPLRLETQEARLLRTRRGEMVFARRTPGGSVWVTNEGDEPERVRLRLTGSGPDVAIDRVLAPGASWRSDEPQAAGAR